MTKQPGGFMGIKPTTTADFINDIIIEQRKEIEKLKRQLQYINAFLQLDDN